MHQSHLKMNCELSSVLNASHDRISDGDITGAVSFLTYELRFLRDQWSKSDWDIACCQAMDHPLWDVIHQDPFTNRAFKKPRGYPGDAELLDYIYGLIPLPSDLGGQAREILRSSSELAQSSKSVRSRIRKLAATIDETVDSAGHARILSIACGHLREAHLSRSIPVGKLREFLAIDQDSQSLETLKASHPYDCVRTANTSVRSILRGKTEFKDFDLVYAAGLYDYLSDDVAARLTSKMFDMLRPGGRVLIPNFAPSLLDIGYMEMFMQWHLIYRDEAQISDVAREIPSRDIHHVDLFRDEHSNIVFLSIQRS